MEASARGTTKGNEMTTTATRTYAVKGAARTAEGVAPKTYTSKNGTEAEALGMLADLRDVQERGNLPMDAAIVTLNAAGTETTENMTAREIAAAIKVGTRTRRYVLRDEYGIEIREGRHYSRLLLAIGLGGRADVTTRIHTVAYALRKCMVSGRMNPISENRIADYTPYQMCRLVARIAAECPETTIGGICDGWLIANHSSL